MKNKKAIIIQRKFKQNKFDIEKYNNDIEKLIKDSQI